MRRWFNSITANLSSNILRLAYLFLVITLLYLIPGPAQYKPYWTKAPVNGSNILTILFTDNLNGKAVFADGELLITKDGGISWLFRNQFVQAGVVNETSFLWKADINCSVMLTTDSGATWIPYNKEKQDHFCNVYLKDENTGYKVAGNFLNNVTKIISKHFANEEIDLLINHPVQCTEYFINADEGWALGWCLKNFIQRNAD